jgi:tRNA threonylcarbamoyladenosine biosynthesis protein TsaE
MIHIKNVGIEKLGEIAQTIINESENLSIVCFYGDLGSGKTTLIKEICKQLKVEDEVKSPTFSIVNEYLTDSNDSLYHFDFYRLKSIEEAYDIGVEEYFDSGNLVFIEWPEIIHSLLPDNRVEIFISYEDNMRNYEIKTLASS